MSPFGGLYAKFRIMFFDFPFVISKHNYSMALQFIDKFCLQSRKTGFSKTGQEKKSLVSVFASFLTAICKA